MELPCTSEFLMTQELQESAGRVQFSVIEKLMSACYFQIALETILLLVSNRKGNVQDKNTRSTTIPTPRSGLPDHSIFEAKSSLV